MIRSKLSEKCYCIIFYSIYFSLLSGCGNTTAIPSSTARDSEAASTEKPGIDTASKPEKTRLDFGEVFSNYHDWEGMDATEEALRAMTNEEKRKLKRVRLRGSRFSDNSMEAIQGLKNIEELWMADNRKITTEGLLAGALPNLKSFYYIAPHHNPPHTIWDKTIITEILLQKLTSLEYIKSLSIGDSYLTDECFQSISDSSSLKSLHIMGVPKFTKKFLKHVSILPALESLTFSSSKWNGEGLGFLKNNSRLTHLGLPSSDLDDNGVKHLEGFQQLIGLNLSNTKITDASMESIAKLKNLKSLYLNDTAITEKSLIHIKKLVHLQRLGTSGTVDHEVFKEYMKQKTSAL